MSKHTPGPWTATAKLSTSKNHRGFWIVDSANTWELADVQPGDEDGNIGHANARLIASAPELLEALKALLAGEDAACSFEDYAAASERARALVARLS